MSHYLWSIDEGHGGLNPSGGYTTPSSKGKQYTFTGDNPLTIYEGHINRMIGRFLKSRLIEAGKQDRRYLSSGEEEGANLFIVVDPFQCDDKTRRD